MVFGVAGCWPGGMPKVSIKSPRGLFVYAKRVYNKEYILGK
jgi:hypothetical protein